MVSVFSTLSRVVFVSNFILIFVFRFVRYPKVSQRVIKKFSAATLFHVMRYALRFLPTPVTEQLYILNIKPQLKIVQSDTLIYATL